MTNRVINNQGVKILLERMDSNPDEFVEEAPYADIPAKWAVIIADILDRVKLMGIGVNGITRAPNYSIPNYTPLPFLSDDEVLEVYEKLNSIRGDLFTKQIMATLLQDNAEDRREELSRGVTLSQIQATSAKLKQEAWQNAELKEQIKRYAQAQGLTP